MRRVLRGCGALVALVLSGCLVEPTRRTEFRPLEASLAPVARPIIVREFVDRRPPAEWDSPARFFLTWIPLLFWVASEAERGDEIVLGFERELAAAGRTDPANVEISDLRDPPDFPKSMPRALAYDLHSADAFPLVAFETGSTGVPRARTRTGPDALELRGTLTTTRVTNSLSSYGLGFVGAALWLAPIPMGHVHAEVAGTLELVDSGSGALLWSGALHGTAERWYSLYDADSMATGPAGAFGYNVAVGPDESDPMRNSLFTWEFAALRDAWSRARPELHAAIVAACTPTHP